MFCLDPIIDFFLIDSVRAAHATTYTLRTRQATTFTRCTQRAHDAHASNGTSTLLNAHDDARLKRLVDTMNDTVCVSLIFYKLNSFTITIVLFKAAQSS